eukprot:scaffold201724_cov32-Tisochrysis_lutea.AAC.1
MGQGTREVRSSRKLQGRRREEGARWERAWLRINHPRAAREARAASASALWSCRLAVHCPCAAHPT